jgi:hypothetical protein
MVFDYKACASLFKGKFALSRSDHIQKVKNSAKTINSTLMAKHDAAAARKKEQRQQFGSLRKI